ncbi:MAG: hypothetical protein J6M92_13060 [Oribacterium sp.]|nr:hypothetical protein [Oribacterium sp.]
MAVDNNFKDYKEEIELSFAQNNGLEIDLYSIIAAIVRKNCKSISLRDVSNRRICKNGIKNRFFGRAGFPDFVVLDRIKQQDAAILGCIEAKNVYVVLENSPKYREQLEGHMESFGTVVYTNGLEWRLFDNKKEVWRITLGTLERKQIKWGEENKFNELSKKLEDINWKK